METGNKILFDVADASWIPNDQAVCNIVLDDSHAVIVVFDTSKQRFVALYSAELSGNSSDKYSTIIRKLQDIDPIISKRNLFVALPKTMLIPNALFEEETASGFLANQHKIEAEEKISHFALKSIDAQMAFAHPGFIDALIAKMKLSGNGLFPTDAPWLNGLQFANKNNNQVHVHFNKSDLFTSIAAFKDGGLQLYNTFETATPEEVLYFIMFVSEQLNINPLKDRYHFSGYIRKGDETEQLLLKYIKELKPEERPVMYNYSMPVLDTPSQLFFNAFCTPTCVS